jgi:uncharacterized protein
LKPAREDGIAKRIAGYDWDALHAELDERGWTRLPELLTKRETAVLVRSYDDEPAFRKRVVMAQHGYGRGEYQYFAYPLPPLVTALRQSLYRKLAPVANRWNESMRIDMQYPASHEEFIARCHTAGQTRATPLLLRYGADDFNALHQDVYGEHLFPLQAMVLLAEPDVDFTGGEFVLTEQRPRMQSRAEVLPMRRGDGVIWAVRQRPVRGARGIHRVTMRHGVSRIRSGSRHTLGVIFHDAK